MSLASAEKGLILPFKSKEAFDNKEGFTPLQGELLEERGFVFLSLRKSIKTLRKEGAKFWTDARERCATLERRLPTYREVAINPNQIILQDSNSKTLDEQMRMVDEHSQQIGQEARGVKAVMGHSSDWAAVYNAYLKKTGKYLFGNQQGIMYTRTLTQVPRSKHEGLIVGNSNSAVGLGIYYWDQNEGRDSIYVATFVAPAHTQQI